MSKIGNKPVIDRVNNSTLKLTVKSTRKFRLFCTYFSSSHGLEQYTSPYE